ncbi:ATP-binding protein [Ruegeria arenilitoris]|uniref:ATP-binding protein n=1 Tax=Ruegeria arenilitoris TaxID=1173585 RepID=UPI00147CDF5B|nr:ATP-binding protein [Ruegeria arenilitoris]
MSSRQWKLRTRLSLSMIFIALTALGVFIVGMVTFYLAAQDIWLTSLSVANQATLQALIRDETISPDALTSLVSAFSIYWGEGGYAQAEFAALIALVTIAALVSVVTGMLVARRLSAPIESVTRAAHEIAQGNLRLDIPEIEGGASETQELLAAFRVMTQGLEKAEREATESSAAIAHELRTPLTILRGRLQGLGDGAFSLSKEMTDGLIAQVDSLSRIVDELGLLSRLSAGRFVPQSIEVDLVEEVERVITTMRPDLDRLGMRMEFSLKPVDLLADPVLIRRALAALIENASRYAACGEYLKIGTFADGQFAYLSVADCGPGIAPSDRNKVFERWWRGEASRNRSEGGTGLGLSVVRAISRAHGGDTEAQ